ncbi:phage tail protein [Streptomyces vinaceus]|uniref:phage tail protein n=1 Tax=Streptomyces vinaceus TaxID=1960 RepID=UPI0036BD2654
MATGDTYPSNRFAVELGNYQVETIQSFSAPSLEQDVVEVRQNSKTGELITRKQPGGHKSGEVTLTRGMDKSPAFTNWLKKTLIDAKIDEARQNITLIQYDANKNVVHRYHFSNAWASRWQATEFNATSTNPATETVTLTYEELTVE